MLVQQLSPRHSVPVIPEHDGPSLPYTISPPPKAVAPLAAALLPRPPSFAVLPTEPVPVDASTRNVILEVAKDAGRKIRLMESRTQARDHPILWAARETQYLKCLILQVI